MVIGLFCEACDGHVKLFVKGQIKQRRGFVMLVMVLAGLSRACACVFSHTLSHVMWRVKPIGA